MNLVSLLVATSVVKYSSNAGLRTGVAVVAVIIVVGAIVVSKRRAHGLGDGTADSAETPAATAPAAVAGPAAPDATVGTAPSARAHEEGSANGKGNGNGHVRTVAPGEAGKPE
jgi:K(+)-stimulated pyrophosphate-energized sodium pump